MKLIKIIKKIIFGEKEVRRPIPFAIVKFTKSSLKENIKDDENKIIEEWFVNKFGNLDKKVYKYSEAMVNILEKGGIPVVDKTREEQKFPVFFREIPGEIKYTR